jgi:hypothetical protein
MDREELGENCSRNLRLFEVTRLHRLFSLKYAKLKYFPLSKRDSNYSVFVLFDHACRSWVGAMNPCGTLQDPA